MNIDCEKSYESYNETNNNHIINIYLKKDEKTCCPNCGSNNVISRGSIKRTLQFANTAENNITLIWQRKRFICKNCNHFFQENNPFVESKKRITVQKDIKILQTLKDINKSEKWLNNLIREKGLILENIFYAFYKDKNLFVIKNSDLK